MHRILVPIDFSRRSLAALRFAADLARRHHAALDLVHVGQDPARADLEPLASKRIELEDRLSAAEGMALAAGAPQVRTRLLWGRTINEVVRAAADGGHVLIVMGSDGKCDRTGSVTKSVARKVTCAVHLVRTLG